MAATETLYPCLHHLESSSSHRVLWALEELKEAHGVQYRMKQYPRVMGESGIKEVHPLGTSPTLCIGPKPDEAMVEGRLILIYLSETYSRGLWKPAEEDEYRDVFFQEFANTVQMKVNLIMVTEIPTLLYPFGVRHLMSLLNWPLLNHLRKAVYMYFQYLDDALSDEKPWFTGRKHGLADFNMSFPLDTAYQRGYIPDNEYPKLRDWLERVHKLPGFKRALQLGGKYNFVTFS